MKSFNHKAIFLGIFLAGIWTSGVVLGAKIGSRKLAEDPVIDLPQGTVQGNILQSREGRDYYAFYKIPYATPPIGHLRFEPPEPAKGWEGILHETEVAPQCIQKSKYSSIVEAAGEEDCLYMNIYTPKFPVGELLPTLFYIHGGGFVDGNGSRYGGKYFMDEDVVLITFQYRIGVFGFLSAEDEIIKGNMGMKDQIMALKWVKDNIQYFGGDPNRVMIFGNSAGGMSVSQLMVSQMAKGLFHRAITQSGPSLSSSEFIHSVQLKTYETIVNGAGCNPGGDWNTTLVLQCLRSVNASDLAVIRNDDTVFGYTIETYPTQDEGSKFFNDTVYNIVKSGGGSRVPWIIGVNSAEWVANAAMILKSPELVAALELDWGRTLQSLLLNPLKCNPNGGGKILEDARDFYFGNLPLGNDTLMLFSDLLSDKDIIQAGIRHGIIQSEFSDVYFYYLNKRPAKSYSDGALIGYPIGDYGTSHADELQYLFDYYGYPEYNPGSIYFSFSRYLISTWAHFASTGETVSDWSPYKPEEGRVKLSNVPVYELIDESSPTSILQNRIEFWAQFTDEELCFP